MTFYEWFTDWTSGSWQADPKTIQWLKSRPRSIKALMLRFPPSCLVKGTVPLQCPASNQLGIVTSYFEPSEEHQDGLVSVRKPPNIFMDVPMTDVRHCCRPEWLQVVGYYKGLTPEIIQQIFDSEGK